MTDQRRVRRNNGSLIFGMAIMLFGVAMLFDQIGIIDGPDYATFWPLVMIATGVVKLSQPRPDGRRHGGWWVFFGGWWLLTQLHVVWLRESWPLFLVALGIGMVWKEMRTHARVE
jgi:hypothetical protein